MSNETTKQNLTVNVRMYCQGLGDCFLLTFKSGEKNFTMMIDCGVLHGTEKAKEKMQEIVKNIKSETGGLINLVVVTHQHWDHISGFEQAQDIFDEIAFEEVWLAWTEDPSNQTAANLNKGFNARLKGLQCALAKLDSSVRLTEEKNEIKQLLEGFFGENFGDVNDSEELGATGKKTSKSMRVKAWDYIKEKSKPNKPRYTYCYPGTEPLTLKEFEGVRIYVFGPPQDPKKIRNLNPPSTEQYRHNFNLNTFSLEDSFFVAVNDEADFQESNACSPFDQNEEGILSEAEAQDDNVIGYKFFNDYYFSGKDGTNSWRRINNDWLGMTSEMALKLDSYTNNTSLVIAIELVESGKVLLFVGDAQSGNWQSWHDYTWQILDKNGLKQKVNAEDLLRRTVLYKVGHHGSHNATLKRLGLEMMSNVKELVALIPVDSEVAFSKRPHKWEMPFDALLEDLQKKTNGRVIASDKGRLTDKEPPTADTGWKSYKEDENKLMLGEKLFIDYLVK